MRTIWVSLAVALVMAVFQGALAQGSYEPNIDRQGSDYHNFDIYGGPAACQSACANDRQCVAWTFVHRNVQGASQRCWLKNSVPPPNGDSCCFTSLQRNTTPAHQPLRRQGEVKATIRHGRLPQVTPIAAPTTCWCAPSAGTSALRPRPTRQPPEASPITPPGKQRLAIQAAVRTICWSAPHRVIFVHADCSAKDYQRGTAGRSTGWRSHSQPAHFAASNACSLILQQPPCPHGWGRLQSKAATRSTTRPSTQRSIRTWLRRVNAAHRGWIAGPNSMRFGQGLWSGGRGPAGGVIQVIR